MNARVPNQYVTVNGRVYIVTTDARGGISIWTLRRYVVPSTVWSAYPDWRETGVSVSPGGKIGRKVLAALEART